VKVTTQIRLKPRLGLNGAVRIFIRHLHVTVLRLNVGTLPSFSFLLRFFYVLPVSVLSTDHTSCCHWPLWYRCPEDKSLTSDAEARFGRILICGWTGWL